MHLIYASVLCIYMSERLRIRCVCCGTAIYPIPIKVSKLPFGSYYLELSPDFFAFVVSDGIKFLKKTG